MPRRSNGSLDGSASTRTPDTHKPYEAPKLVCIELKPEQVLTACFLTSSSLQVSTCKIIAPYCM